jgi:hypothetical protein
MRGLRWDYSRALWGMLLSVTACLAAGAASAQVPVTDYVVVQPINVCSSTGVCPPVINLSDPVTGVNIADSIWSQVGIRVSFLPVVKWNSPTNPLAKIGDQTTDYRTLHVCNCGSGTGACTSPAVPSCGTGSSSNDLTVVSQQPSISMNTVPNPTNPPGGATTCAVANGVFQPPCVPVSTNPTTINQFYGQNIAPPPGQTHLQILGFSWDNGNGSFISSGASADTVAHELGHVLGLEHTTFGAGPLTCSAPYPNSSCSHNLMTAGSGVRKVPSSLNNCGSSGTQSCWFSQVPPNFMATSATPVPLDLMDTNQMGAAQQSGFLNPIPVSTTTATDPTYCFPYGDYSICYSYITFNVTGVTSGGRSGETLVAWALMLPASTASQVAIPFVPLPYGVPRPKLIQDVDYPHGDHDNDIGQPYYLGTTWSSKCGTPTVDATESCLIVEFNQPGAGAKDSVTFAMLFQGTVTNANLCGGEVIYLFSDGAIHSSQLPCSGATTLTTTSQMADLTVPLEIQNPSTFVGATDTPCIPTFPGQTTCSAPVAVSDSNIATGVESGGPICLAHGQAVPCP